jgi:hypothetical protein
VRLSVLRDDLPFASFAHGPPEGAPVIAKAAGNPTGGRRTSAAAPQALHRRNLGKQIEQRDSMRMSKDLVSLWAALAEATNDKERSAVAERIVELDGRWNSAELSSSKLFDVARQIIRERVEKS